MKICFVAHHIYPYLSNRNKIETAGGAEFQQMLIGKALHKKGYDIAYISIDHGQPFVEIIDDLKVYKSYKPYEGIRGVRFFYPRLFKTWRALKAASADIYYVRCATFLPGIVAFFCQLYGKKFAYAGAHDTNFMPDNLRLSNKYEEILYKFGLRHAHTIIVQSEQQKKLLSDNFGRKGIILNNIYPFTTKKLTNIDRNIILWVSTIKSWKRPEQFISLAKKFPSEKFVMIGGKEGNSDGKYLMAVKEKADKVENIEFLGYQPLDITERYFDHCKVFINTSVYEGFPNTFLQAWNRGTPVISYVDPNNVIKREKLGQVVSSEKELGNALAALLNKEIQYAETITRYFENNYTMAALEQYRLLFDKIMET